MSMIDESAVPDQDTLLHVQAMAECAATLAPRLPASVRRVALRVAGCSLELDLAAPPTSLTSTAVPASPSGSPGPTAPEPHGDPAPVADPGTVVLRAPLVGTYFAAPAPGASPFVQEGDHIEVGRQVAILEAMKLMNPVLSDATGVVEQILAHDGEVVEYDQPLLVVRLPGVTS
jgi:acetyl-CoA carboxylase biotin carboxyl carrier protein